MTAWIKIVNLRVNRLAIINILLVSYGFKLLGGDFEVIGETGVGVMLAMALITILAGKDVHEKMLSHPNKSDMFPMVVFIPVLIVMTLINFTIRYLIN